MQFGKGGGRCSERVKGTEQIVIEPRKRDLPRTDGPSGLELSFENKDIPAGVSQGVGRHQSIGTRANHNGVEAHTSTLRTSFSNRRRASPFLT